MKKIIILLLASTLAISCVKQKKLTKQQIITLKKEIDTRLDSWHKAAQDADYFNYFDLLDSVSVYIGTDANEVWNKEQFSAFSKPYFDKGKAWSFKALERNIYFSKSTDVVWFDELLDTWMGLCRGSGVLEKTNNKWKIKHYILSVTVPNDNMNEVIKIKKDTVNKNKS